MGPSDALSVLVIDDNPADYDLVDRLLSRDPDRTYVLAHAETAAAGLEAAEATAPDVIVLDYNLPDDDGLDVLSRLGERSETRPLPVVFTTGEGTEEVAADAIRRGAADYLVKGAFSPVRLRLAVRWAAERSRSAESERALRREFVRRVEAGRAEVQDRWLALAEHLRDGVVVLRDGVVRYANPAALAILGDGAHGARYLDAVPEAERAGLEALWASGEVGAVEHDLGDGPRVRHLAIPGEGSSALQVVLRPIEAHKKSSASA